MNKGFSLVELIVVIAIMAILVGVAVPVYTGYIDKANVNVDKQYEDELKRAVNTLVIEIESKLTAESANYNIPESITWTTPQSGTTYVTLTYASGEEENGFRAALDALIDLDTAPKSKNTNVSFDVD